MIPALTAVLNAIPFVTDLVKTTVTGDKVQQEANTASDLSDLRKQVAAEAARPMMTLWDSFVDGLNRLVRPLFTFGTAGLFVWAGCDPIRFSASMTALQLVPEPLWIVMGTIIVFWFGGKALEGMKATSVSAQAVKQVVGTIAEIKAMAQPATPAPVETAAIATVEQAVRGGERAAVEAGAVPQISEEQYKKEMADDGKPLSLPAIMEWNKRRQDAV